jgi:ABC-type multidrug transport system permease subunit
VNLLHKELREIVFRPMLWLVTLLAGIFLLYATGRIDLEEERVLIKYYLPDDSERGAEAPKATQLMRDIVNVDVLDSGPVVGDLATAMVRDNVDIAVLKNGANWRLIVRSRSNLEHRRLVRYAQLVGLSLTAGQPWYFEVIRSMYERDNPFTPVCKEAASLCATDLRGDSEALCLAVNEAVRRRPESCFNSPPDPSRLTITGLTSDPSEQSRVFIPRVIVLMASLTAFAFACRSVMRDISNNTLSSVLVMTGNRWLPLVAAKVTAAVLIGAFIFVGLVAAASVLQSFHIKSGFTAIAGLQLISLATSAAIGILCALYGRTEARIYLFGSFYLILVVLLSGFIAEIDNASVFLSLLSYLLPMRFAMEPMSNWMLFGTEPTWSDASVNSCLAQFIVCIGLTALALAQLRRSPP